MNNTRWNSAVVTACAISASLAGLLLPSEAKAAVVVDWAGAYVTANQNLVMPTSTISGNTRIYTYSGTTPVTPASGYTVPSGKTGNFYAGTYIAGDTSIGAWSQMQVFERAGTSPDRLNFNRNNQIGVTYSGAVFVAFLKTDFLNGANTQPVSFGSVSGSPVGSLSMEISGSKGTTYRFALLNAGQWYVSQTTTTAAGNFSISSASILSSSWGLWNPVDTSANNRLGAVPTTFATLGSDFTNIQGFGYYVGISGAVGEGPDNAGPGSIAQSITGFTANAIPEPGTVVLLTVAGAFLIFFRNRRAAKV